MSNDCLVNKVVKRSKVGMIGRLHAVPPDQLTILLRFLFVDVADVRIGSLMNTGLTVFNTSIFAPTPSADDGARGGTIGNHVLREAARIFYGENNFVAEDVSELAWFASQIEPECHQFVKTLILSDGAFPEDQNRDADHLCERDRRMVSALRHFTGLQNLFFTFSWNFPSINCDPYAHVLIQFCRRDVLPSLQAINIARVTEPAFLPPQRRTDILAQDNNLHHFVNNQLALIHAFETQPMQS
ncbi:hypothetical protein MMC27_000786 [Xylographa pallens]|nr:hypothetical protein [Xylographa pallens]